MDTGSARIRRISSGSNRFAHLPVAVWPSLGEQDRPHLISLWISDSTDLAPRGLLREARHRRCATRIRVTLRDARAQLPCDRQRPSAGRT